MGFKNDLTGKNFGKLQVIEWAGNDKYNNSLWLCKCQCGKEKIISSNCLVTGNTRSCGCLNDEQRRKKGELANRTVHGMCGTRIYRIWKAMKKRCYNTKNPDYKKWYGSRGIKVCDEWKNDFQVFYKWAMRNGYNDNLSIDRIDVNGNYEPSNCRWATKAEQANNTRCTHLIEINSVTKNIAQWARYANVSTACIYHRLHKGLTGEDLIKHSKKRGDFW